MLGAIGKAVKTAGKAVGRQVKSNVQQSNLGKGVAAFKSWKAKKNEAGGPPSDMIKGGALPSVSSGMSNLQTPKISKLGRGELFKTGM